MGTVLTIAAELFAGFFALASIALIFVLIYEERDPSTTLAWVLTLTLFPVFGVILYVIFGRNWRNIGAVDQKRVAALSHGHKMLEPIYARHAEQAARGEKLYATQCAQCHGEGLTGVEMAPPM